ncbi:MAG: hypothetical protein JNL21_23860 [Myxococcales bacterium]|nr:hypothetical protein [Myxococcales bacterium]
MANTARGLVPVAWLAASLGALSCTGSTGGDLFEFEARAAGAAGTTAGQPYVFTNDRGYTVTLTKATLHVGALYLNQSVPTSVASDTSCILPGIYVAEVTEGLDIDALDPTPRPFPGLGYATANDARTAEIWLTGGDIDAESDPTVIAAVEGTAVGPAGAFPFVGSITIGQNRLEPPTNPAQPGSKPICKQRVVTPIAVDLSPEPGGSLLLRVDPAGWFGNVEFSELERIVDDPPLYAFRDDGEDQPSQNLYAGVRANAGVYRITWED